MMTVTSLRWAARDGVKEGGEARNLHLAAERNWRENQPHGASTSLM